MNEEKKTIKERIDVLRSQKSSVPKARNDNIAFNIAVELVASAIVGVIVGIIFDNLLASKPIFLIICIILSFAAAFKSLWIKYIKQ